jgi:CHASE2 domain-containing sensor protein
MALAVDILHLLVIILGVAVGAWALIALRRRLPRGRFVAFGAASAGALFGCAALAGEVGLLPPVAWFAVVMASMTVIVIAAQRAGRRAAAWR